jgi:hypothetical protein
LGLLKAKLAKCRQALMEGDAKSGAGKVRYNEIAISILYK